MDEDPIRFKAKKYLDPETGEIKEMLMESPPRARNGVSATRDGFVIAYMDSVMKVPRMSWRAFRTFLFLLGHLEKGNTGIIHYNLTEIAEETGAKSVQAAWTQIRKLISVGLLIRVRRSTVMVNPEYFWVGDVKSENKAHKRIAEMRAAATNGENDE